mmetsp:Transcript_43984/g.71561  ORF Transcript_43984/g.71561 Transcript_43984/m.71561 type:complete len:351 (+) Transcript_43984:131-1183(+)|eukprot:CAMPEP_0184644558 /NCGR_PEP_ID=MMETSP0308-20130426/1262_1 /TAXON_ID=38269 /ORGANISM="Gloeochaete witrockiana, Strain SAG 46.84" /LENGTH=350 /DNA_ID=CAMNT_0027073159 /DNA_START=105 /DNA_END=1160 /DNA_ORIENTATION=+
MAPLGKLTVKIVEGDQFKKPSAFGHKAKLFVVVKIGDVKAATEKIPKPTTKPRWDEEMVFQIAEGMGDRLLVELKDVKKGKEVTVGVVTLNFGKLISDGTKSSEAAWYPLTKADGVVTKGRLKISMKFESPAKPAPVPEPVPVVPPPSLESAVASTEPGDDAVVTSPIKVSERSASPVPVPSSPPQTMASLPPSSPPQGRASPPPVPASPLQAPAAATTSPAAFTIPPPPPPPPMPLTKTSNKEAEDSLKQQQEAAIVRLQAAYRGSKSRKSNSFKKDKDEKEVVAVVEETASYVATILAEPTLTSRTVEEPSERTEINAPAYEEPPQKGAKKTQPKSSGLLRCFTCFSA